MNKKLINLITPILFSASILIEGCGNPYENSLKPENWKPKQRQFVNNMHESYGEQVSYSEMKLYVKANLSKSKAKYFNHFLKDYAKKENCLDNINDKALVVVYEAIKKLD